MTLESARDVDKSGGGTLDVGHFLVSLGVKGSGYTPKKYDHPDVVSRPKIFLQSFVGAHPSATRRRHSPVTRLHVLYPDGCPTDRTHPVRRGNRRRDSVTTHCLVPSPSSKALCVRTHTCMNPRRPVSPYRGPRGFVLMPTSSPVYLHGSGPLSPIGLSGRGTRPVPISRRPLDRLGSCGPSSTRTSGGPRPPSRYPSIYLHPYPPSVVMHGPGPPWSTNPPVPRGRIRDLVSADEYKISPFFLLSSPGLTKGVHR